MVDIKLRKVNEATMFVESDNPTIHRELTAYFRCRAKNFRFDKRFKNGWWDGYVNLYKGDFLLPIGLLYEVKGFAKKGGYSVKTCWDRYHDLAWDEFLKYVDALNPTLPGGEKPRPYQVEAAYDAITKKIINIEVPTSGGKTLIAYLICRYLILHECKVLIIVPTTTLVEQMYDDWYDYGWKNVNDCVHRIYSGQKKHFNAPITISTWQSLYKDESLFQEFDVLMIDEAHQAQAKSLKAIGAAAINAQWRIGTSGTFPDPVAETKIDYFNCVGVLGPVKKYTTYQEMADMGWVAQMDIMAIILKYPLAFRKSLRDEIERDFSVQTDAIHEFSGRMEFLAKLIKNLDKNVLVLFTKKEKHGYPLRDMLARECPDKRLIYIDGGVDTEDRNLSRAIMEREDGAILLASYGTFSTGISIKNIHYIVFASSYKSKFKVLQSIGRGLRILKGVKEKVRIFDIVDDCCLSPDRANDIKAFENFSFDHYQKRTVLYEKAGFEWKSIIYKLS